VVFHTAVVVLLDPLMTDSRTDAELWTDIKRTQVRPTLTRSAWVSIRFRVIAMVLWQSPNIMTSAGGSPLSTGRIRTQDDKHILCNVLETNCTEKSLHGLSAINHRRCRLIECHTAYWSVNDLSKATCRGQQLQHYMLRILQNVMKLHASRTSC